MNQIDRAIPIAREWHAGKTYGNNSFFDAHLSVVAHRVAELGYDDQMTIAGAYLHDILEDTLMTIEGLRQRGIREAVICAVEAVSRRNGEEINRYLGRISINPRAVAIKFADSDRNLLATIQNGPSHPHFHRWMGKYPENLRYLQPLLPNPADLRR